jgi:thiamine thiazole synthase
LAAVQGGAVLLNLVAVEDTVVHQDRVRGVVVNRTAYVGVLPVDPITLKAEAVIDATGHDAIVVETLRRRNLCAHDSLGERPMDAASGEAFVVDRAGEVFPGLWVCGMAVCAAFGGPRMGPIFGGMLQSGRRVAELIGDNLRSA